MESVFFRMKSLTDNRRKGKTMRKEAAEMSIGSAYKLDNNTSFHGRDFTSEKWKSRKTWRWRKKTVNQKPKRRAGIKTMSMVDLCLGFIRFFAIMIWSQK
jgi:hypothetical protein